MIVKELLNKYKDTSFSDIEPYIDKYYSIYLDNDLSVFGSHDNRMYDVNYLDIEHILGMPIEESSLKIHGEINCYKAIKKFLECQFQE